jgi:DNA-binding CsgD family transcriptional regulator
MTLVQFQQALAQAKSLSELNKILAAHLKCFGFRAYAFTYYSAPIKFVRKLRYHYVSDALKPWHLYYLEQGYAEVDRTLDESYRQTLPIFWDVNEQLAVAKNNREKRIRLESIEFGIDKGLSLPIHGPQQDFATLTLHQFRGENCLNNYITQQYEWLNIVYLFFHFVRNFLDLNELEPVHYQLTSREKMCLALTAKAWPVGHIAKKLGITERTVNFHLQNANKKLGVSNKHQAVNKLFYSPTLEPTHY